MRIIAGLGNPGKEYEETRHNAGRWVLEEFRQKNKLADWSFDKKLNALISPGIIKKNKVLLVWPETFMNKSGLALKKIIVSKKKAADLIIVHDDLDLPLGKFKISFGKNSGGHKGVESIIKNIKTKDFARIRIGIAPTTPSGKINPPAGGPKIDKHLDFLTRRFKPAELKEIKELSKKISQALETIITDGLQKAMNEFN